MMKNLIFYDMMWDAQRSSVKDRKHWTELLYPVFFLFYHAMLYLLQKCHYYVPVSHVFNQDQRHSRYIVLQKNN
jgi:hypothetical protein